MRTQPPACSDDGERAVREIAESGPAEDCSDWRIDAARLLAEVSSSCPVGLGVDLVAAAGGGAPAAVSRPGGVVEQQAAHGTLAAAEPTVVAGEQSYRVSGYEAEGCGYFTAWRCDETLCAVGVEFGCGRRCGGTAVDEFTV